VHLLAVLLLLCCLPQVHPAAAADASEQRALMVQDVQRVSLIPALELLRDPGGTLSVEDVMSPALAARFEPVGDRVPNFGFTRAAIWAKIRLRSERSDTYFLELAQPQLDRVSVYFQSGETLEHWHTGDHTPFHTRPLDTRTFVFPLPLTAGQAHTVYIRVQSSGSVALPLALMSGPALLEHMTAEYSGLALYFGALLMLMVYNLHHYLRLRDISALYYVLFVAAYLGFQLALTGISFQYLWPDDPWWANASLPFFICAAYLAGIQFTRSILDTGANAPLLHRLLGWLRLLGAVGLLLALFGPYRWAIAFAIGIVFTLIFFIVGGLQSMFRGYRPARYYALAWTVSLSAMIIYAMKTFGLVPTTFWTTWITQIGSTWEAIILAFAISDRFYLLQEEKRQMQARAADDLASANRQLNQLNEELESRVEAGLKDLRESNAQLRAEAEERRIAELKAEAANRAKSDFLANMSHEIRTPMNAVVGFTQLLGRSELKREQRGWLEKIRHAAADLLVIIEDLLDFSKIEAGRVELDQAPFRIEPLVQRVAELVEVAAVRKGLRLEVDCDCPPGVALIGDELRLRQVLVNLLSNAVKFTDAGQVCLRLRCAPVAADRISLSVAVADTGIGMTEEQRQRLFQPFTQADASITRRFGGTGLGLSICDRLVRAMGGGIQVQSTPGHGTTFGFTLRLAVAERDAADALAADPAVPDLAPDPTPAGEQLAGLRVLLVEDQPLNQELAATALQGAGAAVAVAANGVDAIEQLNRSDAGGFDLVLMDLQMPELDGYEATRRIRRQARFKDLPIIAMTANALSGERTRCRAAGMNDYIAKPIDLTRLFEVLRRWHRDGPPGEPRPPPAQQPDAVAQQPTGAAAGTVGTASAAVAGRSAQGVDFAAGLRRAGGDRAAYARLLRAFLREHIGLPARLREALADGDSAAARHAAHAFAGVALNLGLQALGDAARGMEDALARQDAGAMADLAALERLEAQAVPLLEAFCLHQDPATASAPAPGPTQDAADWAGLLQRLDTLLRDRNLRARQVIGELIGHATDPTLRGQLEQVAEHIEQLDCEAARAALKALLKPAAESSRQSHSQRPGRW
jgi:signal transduction histidine kinase/HPt (histidine-containing phosphotransfer) domain-containing protein